MHSNYRQKEVGCAGGSQFPASFSSPPPQQWMTSSCQKRVLRIFMVSFILFHFFLLDYLFLNDVHGITLAKIDRHWSAAGALLCFAWHRDLNATNDPKAKIKGFLPPHISFDTRLQRRQQLTRQSTWSEKEENLLGFFGRDERRKIVSCRTEIWARGG